MRLCSILGPHYVEYRSFNPSFVQDYCITLVRCVLSIYWDGRMFPCPLTWCASPTDLLVPGHPCIPRLNPLWPWWVVSVMCCGTWADSILLQIFATLCVQTQRWPIGFFFLMELALALTLQQYWRDMPWLVCSLLCAFCFVWSIWGCLLSCVTAWWHSPLDCSRLVSWLWPGHIYNRLTCHWSILILCHLPSILITASLGISPRVVYDWSMFFRYVSSFIFLKLSLFSLSSFKKWLLVLLIFSLFHLSLFLLNSGISFLLLLWGSVFFSTRLEARY